MAELKFELHSPITKEEWDLITDVDLDHTPSVMFHTKHGKDVEYVKVKHGRWVASKDGHGCECSECGTAYRWNEIDTMRYCKMCGARMDGGEND